MVTEPIIIDGRRKERSTRPDGGQKRAIGPLERDAALYVAYIIFRLKLPCHVMQHARQDARSHPWQK